jgi:hypothetical protein
MENKRKELGENEKCVKPDKIFTLVIYLFEMQFSNPVEDVYPAGKNVEFIKLCFAPLSGGKKKLHVSGILHFLQ